MYVDMMGGDETSNKKKEIEDEDKVSMSETRYLYQNKSRNATKPTTATWDGYVRRSNPCSFGFGGTKGSSTKGMSTKGSGTGGRRTKGNGAEEKEGPHRRKPDRGRYRPGGGESCSPYLAWLVTRRRGDDDDDPGLRRKPTADDVEAYVSASTSSSRRLSGAYGWWTLEEGSTRSFPDRGPKVCRNSDRNRKGGGRQDRGNGWKKEDKEAEVERRGSSKTSGLGLLVGAYIGWRH
jgi:hypothetical protein